MADRTLSTAVAGNTLLKELIRKSIHVTIAFVPTLASWNFWITVGLLVLGLLVYTSSEAARINGRNVKIISKMTILAARPLESGFVWGPVTLGLGALAALLYYPHPAATVAIYALAFGDGIAGLAGKLRGKPAVIRIGEKTLIGSAACFTAVFIAAYAILNNAPIALLAAATATILELVPFRDADNLIIPLGTGFVIVLVL